MPTLTLNRADIDKLAAFVHAHSIKEIFIAKDQGAYVGASIGKDGNCIFYFAGCNPDKDENWYDTAHSKFGGDDFGELLDAKIVIEAAANLRVKSIKFTITATRMKVESFM